MIFFSYDSNQAAQCQEFVTYCIYLVSCGQQFGSFLPHNVAEMMLFACIVCFISVMCVQSFSVQWCSLYLMFDPVREGTIISVWSSHSLAGLCYGTTSVGSPHTHTELCSLRCQGFLINTYNPLFSLSRSILIFKQLETQSIGRENKNACELISRRVLPAEDERVWPASEVMVKQ